MDKLIEERRNLVRGADFFERHEDQGTNRKESWDVETALDNRNLGNRGRGGDQRGCNRGTSAAKRK